MNESGPSKSKGQRKSLETQELLINSTIGILRHNKFKDVTARKIAQQAGVDPKVIRRNFSSFEGLLIAVYHRLRIQGGESLSTTLATFEESKVARAQGVDLKTRLAAWLITNGTPIEKFHFGDKELKFEKAVWESAFNENITDRSKKAFVALAYVASTGNTIFGPLVEGLDSSITEDGFSLLNYLAKNLEQIQYELNFR